MATLEKRLDDLEKAVRPQDPDYPLRFYEQIDGSDPPRYTLMIEGVDQPGEYTQEDIDAAAAAAPQDGKIRVIVIDRSGEDTEAD